MCQMDLFLFQHSNILVWRVMIVAIDQTSGRIHHDSKILYKTKVMNLK